MTTLHCLIKEAFYLYVHAFYWKGCTETLTYWLSTSIKSLTAVRANFIYLSKWMYNFMKENILFTKYEALLIPEEGVLFS